MEPISWLLLIGGILIGAAAGGGGVAAVNTVANNRADARTAEALDSITDRLTEEDVVEERAQASVVDKLTDPPIPCLVELGGDPSGPMCMAALCMRTGESEKQRCTQLDDLLEDSRRRWLAEEAAMSCPESSP